MALLWPLCIGRSLYWGDILFYFEPMARYGKSVFASGRIPFWNPLILCGQPYLGNPQMGLFYPTIALLAFVPPWLYISINTLLHVFLCGAFMFRFLERWSVRRAPALAGAFVYIGSAPIIGRLQFPTMVQTAAYFPLLLLTVDAFLDNPGPARVCMLAIVLALTALAAHAQLAYLIIAVTLCYTVMRQWRRAPRQHRDRAWIHFAAGLAPLAWAALLGVGLSAIQMLPTLQLITASSRERLSAGQANRFVLEPAHLLTLVWPRFFGHPASADYWGGGNAWEPALFMGWVPLLALMYAVVRCGRERLVRFWSVLGVLCLWLSFGTPGGLYTLAFYLIPGVSAFHDPARFLFVLLFACAVLTCVGLDALQARARKTGVRYDLAVLALVAVPLVWYGHDWNPTVSPREAFAAVRRPSDPVRGRIYLPEEDLYWRRFVTDGYSDYGAENPQSLDRVRATLIPNLSMDVGIPSASGYEPVPIAGTAGLDGLARAALRHGEPDLSRLLVLMNANTVLLPSGSRVADPRLVRVDAISALGEGGAPDVPGVPWRLAAWRNSDALPRAWLVRRTRRVEGKMRIVACLAAPTFDPALCATVSGSRGLGTDGPIATTAAPCAPVRIVDLSEARMRLTCFAGAEPAFLVVSAAVYPGWIARVNGRPVPIERADLALIGVPVPRGADTVEIEFIPASYRAGAYMSLGTIAILLAMVAWRFGTRRPAAGRN